MTFLHVLRVVKSESTVISNTIFFRHDHGFFSPYGTWKYVFFCLIYFLNSTSCWRAPSLYRHSHSLWFILCMVWHSVMTGMLVNSSYILVFRVVVIAGRLQYSCNLKVTPQEVTCCQVSVSGLGGHVSKLHVQLSLILMPCVVDPYYWTRHLESFMEMFVVFPLQWWYCTEPP